MPPSSIHQIPLSKTNKNHHQSTTILPKSTQNPTTQKTHLPNPSTHSNLPIKPTKNYPKSNQITKPRSSSTPGRDRRSIQVEIGAPPRLRSSSTLSWDRHSTPGRDRSFNRGERAGEKGRKEKEKREEREPIVEMREGKKKKKIKKWDRTGYNFFIQWRAIVVFHLWKVTVAIWQYEEWNRELLEHHFFILALHIPK